MTVYELRPEVEQHQWLDMVNEEDFDVTALFDGNRISNIWQPVPVEVLTDELSEGAVASDFPALGDIPTFSERAIQMIGDLLKKHGEVLPLSGPAGEYYAYNVTTVLDALDEDASVLTRFEDGEVMDIDRPVFNPDIIKGHAIFKIPQLKNEVFVTEAFKDAVEQNRLAGFSFRPVWAESPF